MPAAETGLYVLSGQAGIIRMRRHLKALEVDCRLQAPVASLSLMGAPYTIEICRGLLCRHEGTDTGRDCKGLQKKKPSI